MARYINQSRKTLLRVKQGSTRYKQLCNAAQALHTKLTGNADFAVTSPLLATLQTAINNLRAAMIYMGQKRNRPSKVQSADVAGKALALKSLMTSLNVNLQNTAYDNTPDDVTVQRSQLATTGGSIKLFNKKTKATLIQVRNFHQSNNKAYPQTLHRIAWKRPIGLIKGKRPTSYNIWNHSVPGGVPRLIATTTATNYIVDLGAVPFLIIGVAPVTSAGEGQQVTIKVV